MKSTPEWRLFLGVLDHKDVVIKITTDYNVQAHKLLANYELGLKLYGSYPLMRCGQLKMVVMDRVDGIPISEYDEHSLPASVSADIKTAIDLLHTQDLVLLILRAAHIMVMGQNARDAY